MLNNRFVALAVAIFCLPLGIVTTLQIEHLQPEWVWWAVRWLLALTAGLSWAGGIAVSFYLRALYGNSVPLLLVGGLGMGAFYGTYYTGTAGAWFGPAYAALTACFDFLWLERVLHCVGKAQKEQAGVETIKINMPLAVLAAQKALQDSKNDGKRLDKEKRLVISETHTRMVSASCADATSMHRIEPGPTASLFALPEAKTYPCPLCGEVCKNGAAKAAHMRWRHMQGAA